MPLAGGQGRNLGVQFTRGAYYAHHITASPPGFENPAASLHKYSGLSGIATDLHDIDII